MLGIIGGSGLYQFSNLKNTKWEKVSSLYGDPSDELLFGQFNDIDVVFLPRHGRGHHLIPSEINYRANIDVLKKVGVNKIVSFSAVGSLQDYISPGDFVLSNQFIDLTKKRISTFFENGLVGHVSMAIPICARLHSLIWQTLSETNIEFRYKGNYVCIEGPQFSSKAESNMCKILGGEIIGMTAMPEAKLAREAEICYTNISMVTDFDCWHHSHAHVNASDVLKVMNENIHKSHELLGRIIPLIHQSSEQCVCQTALNGAIYTSPDKRDPEVIKKVSNVMKRVL